MASREELEKRRFDLAAKGYPGFMLMQAGVAFVGTRSELDELQDIDRQLAASDSVQNPEPDLTS